MHRSEKVFTKAKKFLPERWLLGKEQLQAAAPDKCPATGSSSYSGGCPYLRAQALAAAGTAAGGTAAATASSPLAAALERLGASAAAAMGLERFASKPGEATPGVGAYAGQAVEPAPQGNHPEAFKPFGSGARSCPGRNLAMMEIRLFVIKVLSRYSVALAPGVIDPEEVTAETNRMDIYVSFNPRVAA